MSSERRCPAPTGIRIPTRWRRNTPEFREHWRRKLRDRELEQMIEEINAKKARDERRNRPIMVKRFTV